MAHFLKNVGKYLKTPDVTDPLGDIVDWLEIRLLADPRSPITHGDVLSWLSFLATTDELVEVTDDFSNPIDSIRSDQIAEQLADSVFDEVARRAVAASDCYPFELHSNGRFVKLSIRSAFTAGQWTYLFALLATESALLRFLPVYFFDKQDRQQIPDLLQILGTIAASGLIYGEALSFGFPRKKIKAFREALSEAVQQRLKEGEVRTANLVGAPISVKDAGVDVIAWRHFPDQMPGKLLLLGQCASGKNEWREKSVQDHLSTLFQDFFIRPFSSTVICATFVPFSVAHSPELVPGATKHDTVAGAYRHYTSRLGIVIDRCRLAFLVPIGLKRYITLGEGVEGAERFREIEEWVQYCLTYLRNDSFFDDIVA